MNKQRTLLLKREREVLFTLASQPRKLWFRPMDVGGRDASWHQPALARLVRKGLVERRRRGTLMNEIGSRRGSYRYRATRAGVALAFEWAAVTVSKRKP